MSDSLASYGSSPNSLDESTIKQTIDRVMVLQFFALDFCILKQIRELRQYLLAGNYCREDLPIDAYYLSPEIISGLEKLSNNGNANVLVSFKKYVIYKSFQEMWSYAIASPSAIHDFQRGPQIDVEDAFDVYRTTDRADPKISAAYEEAQQKIFLTQLTKVNRGTPLHDQNVLHCCLEVASHVGLIKDNSQASIDRVITDLFGQDAHSTGIHCIEEDAGLNAVVNTIMSSMPNDVLGSLNSSFLYNVIFAWQKLFSDSQSDLFDIIYDRLSTIEDRFISSTSSGTQLDYRHEADEFVVNTLKKWKTGMRIQELWNLSREPSPVQISAALRSLEVLEDEMIFMDNADNVLKSHSRKKSTNVEPELTIVRKDGTKIVERGEVGTGELVKLVCRNLKPNKKYELLIVPNKGTEKILKHDLVTNNDGSIMVEIAIEPSFEEDFSIHLRSEKTEKVTGPSLHVSPQPVSPSTAIIASTGSYDKFWSVGEDRTGRLGWNYLIYFSLLLQPRIADLFIFAIENATSEEKENLHLKVIIPYAMYPGIIDPSFQGYSGSIPTLDFDKITRNNLLVGDRVRKTGALSAALSDLGEELL